MQSHTTAARAVTKGTSMRPAHTPDRSAPALRIVGSPPAPELPSDIDAEKAVLGSALINREAVLAVKDWLQPDRFYLARHQQIYQVICDLASTGTPPDVRTVAGELRARGQLEQVGGLMYLTEVTQSVPTSYHIEQYGTLVDRAAWHRDMIQVGGQIAALGYSGEDDSAIAGQAETLINGVLGRRAHGPALATNHITDLWAKQFPPLAQLIPGLLIEGVTLFSGKAKQGKSLLTMAIAAAVASGGIALGREKVELAGDVLYLLLEDPEAALQERLETILQGRPNIPFYYRTEWPAVGNGGIEQIAAFLRERPATRMVVIDTFAAIAGAIDVKKSGIYRADYDSLRPIQRLAAAHPGLAIIVNTHSRKADGNDPIDDISGSVGKPGAVDHTWVLRRGHSDQHAELHYTLRRGGKGARHLTFDPHLITWRLGGDAKEVALTALRLEILDALADGPLHPGDVTKMLTAAEGHARKQFQILMRQKLIEKDDRSGRYSLTDAGRDRLRGSEDQTDRADQTDQRIRDSAPLDDTPFTQHEQASAAATLRSSDPRDPSDPSDPLIRASDDIFHPVPLNQRVTLRLRLHSGKPDDQEVARERCERYGIDYRQAWQVVNNSTGEPPEDSSE